MLTSYDQIQVLASSRYGILSKAATKAPTGIANPATMIPLHINTLADAKIYADCICTSSNCVKVVNSMEADTILFAPDQNLANYVAKRTDKKIIPVPEDGRCAVHHNIRTEDILDAKKKYPNAKLTVHPEVQQEIQDIADHIGSTKQMIEYVQEDPANEFIIGTEIDIIHRMKAVAPDKKFYPSCDRAICRNMKKINLENLYSCLKDRQFKVEVPQDIAEKAKAPIERMLALK